MEKYYTGTRAQELVNAAGKLSAFLVHYNLIESVFPCKMTFVIGTENWLTEENGDCILEMKLKKTLIRLFVEKI